MIEYSPMSKPREPYQVFEDRRYRLFGRDGDVRALLGRCGAKGFTLITGRPRMGKTWLVEESCRRLVDEMGVVVGYFECPGGPVDAPLRAVADAYARWLSSASFREQGRSLVERHRGSLIGRVGETVGSLLEKAAKGGLELPVDLGIEKAFRSLAAVDRDLKTGGLQLPPLPYDQARDLVSLLARLSGQDVVLVFDQWEKSEDWRRELALVDTYLRNPDDWPEGHVVAVVRDEPASEELIEKAKRTIRDWPAAEHHRLPSMDLSGNEGERLADLVRNRLPDAAEGVSDERLVALTDGYPGVVDQWTNSATRKRIRTTEDLDATARDAQANRFPELEAELGRLRAENQYESLALALRLSLVPSFERGDAWEVLEPIVLTATTQRDLLIDLQDRGVLSDDSLDVPTFGHETRREVTVRWGIDNARARTRQQAIQLITRAAELIQTTEEPQAILPTLTILETYRRAADLTLTDQCDVFYQSCRSLLGETDHDTLRAMAIAMEKSPLREQFDSGIPLLAMGLLNTLNAAKSEDDLSRRDALLEELRGQASAHPGDGAVREQLARALAVYATDSYYNERIAETRTAVTELENLSTTGGASETIEVALLAAAAMLWDLHGRCDDSESQQRLLRELKPWELTRDRLESALAEMDALD